MSSEVTPVVSFCIPVYNNAEAAVKIVNSLLSSSDMRFEVVVSDDASTDNAEDLLSAINDERFRYCRNEKNLGAHKNWEHSLELGKGEWLYLIMGRDKMNGENIGSLINILDYARENNILYLKDGYTKRSGKEIQVFDGIKAMLEFTRVLHPTGDIYNGEIFRNIPDRTRYYEISDMYPENYIKHYLLLRGKGAYVMSGVHIFENNYSSLVDFSKVKSSVESKKDISSVYFSPKRRTVQNLELIDMIDGDETFSQDERDLYFSTRFRNITNFVSLLWLGWCSDYLWMAHYGHKIRNVSIREMVSNIFTACKDTKTHLQEKGTLTPKRQRIIRYCFVKALFRAVVYYPIRAVAKKILEPLGIWSLLMRGRE